jgi:hypothetical protein
LRIAIAIAALLTFPALGRAHDLWLEPDGAGLVLRHGHRGGELLPVPAGKLAAARCLQHGTTRELLPEASSGPREVGFAARCEAASVSLDGGYWSLTPDGEVNRPKDAVPQAVKAWASRQFAKWVDARSAGASAVLGDELELVPATALGKLKVGDKYAVRVLLQGKPVAGATVAAGHRTLGETDRDGVLRVRVHAPGVQSVSASVRRPLGTPQADTLVLEASLTFEVGG